ncbi:hypothetical protein ACN263_07750 [Micromonospora sp. WMMD729]|uniref:hypothetical protein n=1 Tax=Micromonospora sp. WMMD729 TaxID=3404127 RepID=UPI003BF5AD2A
MGDVRGRMRDELARHVAPPLGDLVQQSMVQGRRLRRRRRLAQFGAGGSALVVLLLIGLAIGPRLGGDAQVGQPGTWDIGAPGGAVESPTPSPAQTLDSTPGGGFEPDEPQAPGVGTSPTPTTTVIDTVRIGAGPDGELQTTTPQAALELLTRLLPKGTTSGAASLGSGGAGPGMPFVQIYLDRGDGPGMVRLSIHQDRLGGDPVPGTVELTEVPGNCIQDKMITVYHRNGLQVDVLISTCLAWAGKGNSPAPVVLSVDEAIAIAANPTWGTRLPVEIVAMGAKKFSNLARSDG